MLALLLGTTFGCRNVGVKTGGFVELGFSNLEIIPSEDVSTSSTLLCEAILNEGLEVSEVPITYEWRVGSTTFDGEELTLDPETMVPQTQVTCTASISRFDETFSDSVSVQIENSLPTVDVFTVTPEVAYVDSSFELTAEFSDSDLTQSEYLDLSIEWHVIQADGTDRVIEGENGFTFENGNLNRFEKGESVYALGTATDGMGTGEPVQSNIVPVLNTPPPAPVVSITAENRPADMYLDDLTCIAERPDDLDGDELIYTFTWLSPNGDAIQTTTTSDNESTLPVSLTDIEGTWTCSVEVSDGDSSSNGEDTYVVQNPDCLINVDVLIDGQSYGMYEYIVVDLDTEVSFGLMVFGKSLSDSADGQVDNYTCDGTDGVIHSSTFDDPNEWWVGSLGGGSTDIANGTLNVNSGFGRITLQNSEFTLMPETRYAFDMYFGANTNGFNFLLSNESSTSGCGMPYDMASCEQDSSQEIMISLFRDGASVYNNAVCFSFESSLMTAGQWGVYNDCTSFPSPIADGWHNVGVDTTYSLACGL